MLYDPSRHEALQAIPWDEHRVREAIAWIAADAEARYTPDGWWPPHPRDLEADDDATRPSPPLYFGACGMVWALHYLQDLGVLRLQRDYRQPATLAALRALNESWLGEDATREAAAYLMGELPIRLVERAALEAGASEPSAPTVLSPAATPTAGPRPALEAVDARLAALIEGNRQHPAKELMWGSPGTLLAALFLHRRTGDERWAALFRDTAATLRSQLLWSDEFGCHYWLQDLYGQPSTYIDAVHGFVGTALPLIQGRHLLPAAEAEAWLATIENTVRRTATREGGLANWRAWLTAPPGKAMLMQYCHGAPGFVICLADLPGRSLDELLCAAGEAIWVAGPLNKGGNLCHGTGGNGYAFLKLYQRTGEAVWLQRARAFAMHALAQAETEAREVGRLRYSLWTGDIGLAIYLWDCLRGQAAFPTLDVFFTDPAT